jgi:hypothetical protein
MSEQTTNGEFAGLTTTSCAAACNPETGCVISGDICIHPHKAGMQAAHRMRPATMAAFAAAKRQLEVQALSAKHAQEQKHGTE